MNTSLAFKSLLMLLLGGIMFAYFSRIAHPDTPPPLIEACIQRLSENRPPSAELSESLKKCQENSFALTVTANNVGDAAQEISSLTTNRLIFTILTVVSAAIFLMGLLLLLWCFRKKHPPQET